METVEGFVRELIYEQLSLFTDEDKERVTQNEDLYRELGADSLDIVEMVGKIEASYDWPKGEITDEEWQEIRTYRDVVNCVKHHLGDRLEFVTL